MRYFMMNLSRSFQYYKNSIYIVRDTPRFLNQMAVLIILEGGVLGSGVLLVKNVEF